MKLSLLFLLLLGTFAQALAAGFTFTSPLDCTDVRLDKTDPVLRAFPIMDQTDTKLCSVHVASQLYGQASHSGKLRQSFASPWALAFEHAKLNRLNRVIDVPILQILRELPGIRMCPTTVAHTTASSNTVGNVFWEIEKQFLDKSRTPRLRAQSIDSIVRASGLFAPEALSRLDIEKIIDSAGYLLFMANMFEQACSPWMQTIQDAPPLHVRKSADAGTLPAWMNTIGEASRKLLRDGQPFGVSYCRDALSNPKAWALLANGEYSYDRCNGVAHTSVVVGRRLLSYEQVKNGERQKGQICQLLVKDSYGQKCEGPAFDPGSPTTYRCERGAYWIDEDILFRNSAEVFWYQPLQ